MKVVFDFSYLMHGKESIKMRLHVLRVFHEIVYTVFVFQN